MVSELLSKNERNRLSTHNTEMIVIDLLDQSIHSSKELAERIENKQLLQISNWRLLIIDFLATVAFNKPFTYDVERDSG